MSQGPYSSYHGRKRHLRSALVGIVAALVVVLAAVLAGYYFGFLNIPGAPVAPGLPGPSAPPVQSAEPTSDPTVIIEAPSAPPSATPAPTQRDLSAYVPRDIPLGLVTAQLDALPEAGRHGVLIDMTDVNISNVNLAWTDMIRDPDDVWVDPSLTDTLAGYPYAAAWLAPDWSGMAEHDRQMAAKRQEAGNTLESAVEYPFFADALAQRCADLAALGFDELVFSAADLTQVGDVSLAGAYTIVHDALTSAGWKGRLGLELDLFYFSADSDVLIPCVAEKFDRLYFRKTLSAAGKNALTQGGFEATGYTLVTVVKGPASLNYAWAVLP